MSKSPASSCFIYGCVQKISELPHFSNITLGSEENVLQENLKTAALHATGCVLSYLIFKLNASDASWNTIVLIKFSKIFISRCYSTVFLMALICLSEEKKLSEEYFSVTRPFRCVDQTNHPEFLPTSEKCYWGRHENIHPLNVHQHYLSRETCICDVSPFSCCAKGVWELLQQ